MIKQSTKQVNKSTFYLVRPLRFLSIINSDKYATLENYNIAFLMADGFDNSKFQVLYNSLTSLGATVKIIAPQDSQIIASDKSNVQIDYSIQSISSIFFDAVLVIGSTTLKRFNYYAQYTLFIWQAYKHYKTIALIGNDAKALLPNNSEMQPGIIIGQPEENIIDEFILALIKYRHWQRDNTEKVPV